MSRERKVLWIAGAVIVAALAAFMLWPTVEERRAPEPTAAWVGIEVEGSGVAEVGPVEIPAGTGFTLRAVVEATTRDGGTIYYTEAPALSFAGVRAPDDALHRWERRPQPNVLWFTVEGVVPYLELASGDDLDRFQMLELLRSDWPFAWSVPGRLDAANDDLLAARPVPGGRAFGTQRFQVRIDIPHRDDEESVLPARRLISWGKDQLPDKVAEFPTVTAALPGPAGPASAVFGLTEIEPATPSAGGSSTEPAALLQRLAELTSRRLAFGRVPLLAEVIGAAGFAPGTVPWSELSLDGRAAWGSRVNPGDLLRVGDRVVVLYRDAPAAGGAAGDGVLDRSDLCFDYVRGAAVRPLADVFEAGGGEVGWAPLGAAAP